MGIKQASRAVFWFEAIVINAGVGIFCFALPGTFLSQFASGAGPAAAVETIRWYGVLLWVLAALMIRALPRKDDRVLRPAVEALLLGDIAHIAASWIYFSVVPAWTFPFLSMIVMSLFLALVRIAWLLEDGRDRRAAAVGGSPTAA
jgi:hypothetical protein